MSFSSGLYFPTSDGFHISPEDLREAVRFITERGDPRIKEFWKRQMRKLEYKASLLTPKLNELRESIDIDHSAARARLNFPLLGGLLAARDV